MASTESSFRKSVNDVRRNNERLLAILLKLTSKIGGFDKLGEYGLTGEEIEFLEKEFPSKNPGKNDKGLCYQRLISTRV